MGRNSCGRFFDGLDFMYTDAGDFNEQFLFSEYYTFPTIMGCKCQNTEFCGGHLGFWREIVKIQAGSHQF